MSHIKATDSWRNLHSTPVKLFVKSGPWSRCLFNDSLIHSSTIEHHANFIQLLWMIDAVVANVPNIVFRFCFFCLFTSWMFWLLHLDRHLFGITVLDHLLHKFNIILSVFLSVSSLEPFFQLIEPAKRCISIGGEFNVFVLQRQQKLLVAIFALTNPFLFQEILSSLESPNFNVFLYSTKSSSNIILIDCRWIYYLLCFLV